MDKVFIGLQFLLNHWEFFAPILFFGLDYLGRKVPTIKRGSLWSSLGKMIKAIGSIWFLGPVGNLLDMLGELFFKIGDHFNTVVPDKIKPEPFVKIES